MLHLIGVALAVVAALGEDVGRAKAEANPRRRIMVLMNQSEHSGPIGNELEKGWLVDQPSHLTPERVHGGVGQ
jgi:hypothetical protein